MSRNPGAKILRANGAVTKAAMAFGAERKMVTTEVVEAKGFTAEVPEVNGVFMALQALQIEEHTRASTLLEELSKTTDGRRRGEIRRHYNTICKNIERNNQVLNALLDKKIGTPKKAKKPTKKATKAEKPKTPAKKKVTPEQVKKAASKRKSSGSRGRRATLEKLSFKELQQWAKKRSISAAGSKEEIINRILGA